jgi:hypothetical protein
MIYGGEIRERERRQAHGEGKESDHLSVLRVKREERKWDRDAYSKCIFGFNFRRIKIKVIKFCCKHFKREQLHRER